MSIWAWDEGMMMEARNEQAAYVCMACKGSGLINTENGWPATNEQAHRADVDQCASCDGTGDVRALDDGWLE